jgi:coenzyme Q-binding protein COQ10
MSTKFHHFKTLPYSQKLLFEIVADVQAYPDFLPWCQQAIIHSEKQAEIEADLVIGYGPLSERYTSIVKLNHYERVDVQYQNGPFKYLDNYWAFKKLGPESTEVEFYIDFQFKSFLKQKAMATVFKDSVASLMVAFEKRAKEKARK